MPRARRTVAAQSVEEASSPKKTRSSTRVSKNVENSSSSRSREPSSSKPSKAIGSSEKSESKSKMKSGKETAKKHITPKISVERKKRNASSIIKTPITVETVEKADEKTTKTRGSVKKKVAGSKSDSVERESSSLDQSLVRKSARSKKETTKFSNWKESGKKSRKNRGPLSD